MLLLFFALGTPTVWLGLRSLRWITPTQRALIIGSRLVLLWLLILLLAGVRWQRVARAVETVVLRDVSASIQHVVVPKDQSVQSQVDALLRDSMADKQKQADDKIGVVRFDRTAQVESLPSDRFITSAASLNAAPDGTDLAAAVNLGLACFSGNAQRRLVLVSDGNATQGQLDSALAAASAARVPIDVLPLGYSITREISLDRLAAPSMLADGVAPTLNLVLHSQNPQPVRGKLDVLRDNQSIELRDLTLNPGATAVSVAVPPLLGSGLHTFHATFSPNNAADDTITVNNSADAITIVRGKARVLYVDNEPGGAGTALADALQSAKGSNWQVDRVTPAAFPSDALGLQSYDAVVLANVPRGPDGIDRDGDALLSHYVRDGGGGLLMIGGPASLGAGAWQESEVEKILPVKLTPPALRVLPAGALLLVLDHSGSMGEAMPGAANVTKQITADESAVVSLTTLKRGDWFGVIMFDDKFDWVVPLKNSDFGGNIAAKLRAIEPAGGTSIGPALDQAVRSLEQLPAGAVGIKRILLMTDGMSAGYDYPSLLARMKQSKITLSTIAVGGDADVKLLKGLAVDGGGEGYVVMDPARLKQVFVNEARTLRRSMVQENNAGFGVLAETGADASLQSTAWPDEKGFVLTARREEPGVQLDLTVGGSHDPLLARRRIGLGTTSVFTADATARWSRDWLGADLFAGFWSQRVRDVARPTGGGALDLRTVNDGTKTHLVVEAGDATDPSSQFLNISGHLLAADGSPSANLTLSQTGPGRYEATIDSPPPGQYAVALQSASAKGERSTLLDGLVVPASVESRSLQQDDRTLRTIAERTGGRLLKSFSASDDQLFTREGLSPVTADLPITNILIPVIIGCFLVDVAVRRIAWDRALLRSLLGGVRSRLAAPTPTDRNRSVAALASMRNAPVTSGAREAILPKPRQASSVSVVSTPTVSAESKATGGSNGPLPNPLPAYRERETGTTPTQGAGNLFEAKRRARKKMDQ